MPGSRHLSLSATPWATPPTQLSKPEPGAVHLWRVPLTGDSTLVAYNGDLLSSSERERAERFHFQRDRNTFIIARGTLRHLLGQYLNRTPQNLTFDYGPYGKPFLANNDSSGLNFNVSHAAAYALIGFTTGQPIGVDLEAEDPTIEIKRLTKRFFSPSESRQVLALPGSERVPAFFRTWTRKEAFLKANGVGLSLPLDKFSVTVDLDGPVSLERINWAPGEASNWSLASFMVTEELPGAVTVESTIKSLRFYDIVLPTPNS